MKKQQSLFVCGCAESGTSEVTTWLNRSDIIAIGMERYQVYWQTHMKLPPDALSEERFFDIRPGDTWYDTLDQFSAHYARLRQVWKQAQYIGDKVPGFRRNLPALLENFPFGKVICTHRDPFAVARSYKVRSMNASDENWGKHRDVGFAIQDWNESVRKIVDFFNSDIAQEGTPNDRCFILKYEDFINNCIDRRGLSKFLGHSMTLPVIDASRAENFVDKPEVLSEIEKDLIWALLDTRLAAEMRRIIDNQKQHFSKLKVNPEKPRRREWYHTPDKRDADIEYGEFQIPGCGYVFRGRSMALDVTSPYAACIGSATTFGRFLHTPYPAQLETLTGMPFINLGIGGARPESYLAYEPLTKVLQDASLVILEVMSARGCLSPFFEPTDPAENKGQFMDFFGLERFAKNDTKLDWLLTKVKNKKPVFIDRVYEITFKYLTSSQRDLIRDALIDRYCSDIRSLLERIGKPVVALFMSRNQPYQARRTRNPSSYEEWSGAYPHFVDEVALRFLEQLGVPVVISRSQRGFPYAVKNWQTGEPAPVFSWQKDSTLNNYYPSQEMHDDAVLALMREPLIKALYDQKQTGEG